ncbi:MAG: DUF4093 domain-containing protein [Oscillospiraceae bacterium]
MSKIRVNEVIIVEGKYDAAKLANIVDGLILTTDGFSVFASPELRELILRLGEKRGIVVLTDSDAAGFRIRTYINNFAQNISVKNAYIPCVQGKESRKDVPSKEGLLGVEGVTSESIINALLQAGVGEKAQRSGRDITYNDLYTLGISGGQGSAEKRRALLLRVGLPARLSKKALREVLSNLYSYEELEKLLSE